MAYVMIEPIERIIPAAKPAAADVSILIVTWNSERWIERCLWSIPAACEGLEYEVLLHDNASTDATLDIVKEGGRPVRQADGTSALHILRSDRNDGFAAGMNRAISASRGRYVILLNPDCELEPRALTLLFDFLESRPHVAAAVPLLIEEDGTDQREFQLRRLPTLGTLAAEVLMLDKLFPRNPATARYRYRDLDLTEPRRIEQPAAAALVLRRTVVDEIGAFDEQFAPAWFEDVDYCRRLAERKKEVWVVPDARVRHFGGASLEHMAAGEFIDVWYRNMWRYARKWLPAAHAEALRWVIIFGMLLRCGAALLGMKPRAMSRRAAIRAWANVLRKASKRWAASSRSSS
ncbi:MAG TPA: glycosyltransferase family 2 protein [Thermoanaerobaculia bacterium]|nr:glycosyltransferase family 2 protein [Thermoanaerobaculia bacterium]